MVQRCHGACYAGPAPCHPTEEQSIVQSPAVPAISRVLSQDEQAHALPIPALLADGPAACYHCPVAAWP